jgi:hypothetical protein
VTYTQTVKLVSLCMLAACMGGTSYVRDPEGRPLATSARMDADMEPATVHCGGVRYLIVEPPPPYMTGNHMANVEIHVRDAATLCAKIRAAD